MGFSQFSSVSRGALAASQSKVDRPSGPVYGQFWRGGYYIGDLGAYRLIISPKAQGNQPGTLVWKTSNTDSPGTDSFQDGWLNTISMNNSSHPLAQWARALSINGYSDWYLPAIDELDLLYRNRSLLDASERNTETIYWSSTQGRGGGDVGNFSAYLQWQVPSGQDGLIQIINKNNSTYSARAIRREPILEAFRFDMESGTVPLLTDTSNFQWTNLSGATRGSTGLSTQTGGPAVTGSRFFRNSNAGNGAGIETLAWPGNYPFSGYAQMHNRYIAQSSWTLECLIRANNESNQPFNIFRSGNGGVGILKPSGQNWAAQLSFCLNDDASSAALVDVSMGTAFTTAAWHHLVVGFQRIGPAQGKIIIWVNGTIVNTSDINFGSTYDFWASFNNGAYVGNHSFSTALEVDLDNVRLCQGLIYPPGDTATYTTGQQYFQPPTTAFGPYGTTVGGGGGTGL